MSDNIANALAGAGGGIVSMLLTYPLITVSTRSQVSKEARATQVETCLKIIKQEGFVGLYSGVNSALFGIAVTQYVYYYFYEYSKSLFQGATKKVLSVSENMMTGAVAGALTSLITNPIWVLNTRLIVKSTAKNEPEITKRVSAISLALYLLTALF